MVGRFASGGLLGAWLRFAESRYAAGGAGVSGATLWDTALEGHFILKWPSRLCALKLPAVLPIREATPGRGLTAIIS